MRNFFTKIWGTSYSDELFDYLCDLIDKYELDTFNISGDIGDFPDDIIPAVLHAFCCQCGLLLDVDIYLMDHLEVGDSEITFEYDLEVDREYLKDYSIEEQDEVDKFLTTFRSIIEDLNVILNAFG